MRPFFV